MRNGIVHSFSAGLDVGSHARVEGVTIRSCSTAGLIVNGDAGHILDNIVVDNPVLGMQLDTDTAYGGNNFSNNASHFTNGAPIATNLCNGKTCTAPPLRRYYLTTTSHDGAQADESGVCAPGFHFASLWEIIDPSNLTYDTFLGFLKDDSGAGPPAGIQTIAANGWIRTGFSAEELPTPGRGNCHAWTSAASDWGTTAWLLENWDTGVSQGLPIGPASGPWVTDNAPCNVASPVWCVQD